MSGEYVDPAASDPLILILADDVVSARLLNHILSRGGYRVREVGNIGQLRPAIAKLQPALILLDVVAPSDNVYELCQQLKADVKTALIPVIFVSALQQVSDKVRAFDVGAADFLTKPFHPAEVLARVGHQMRLSRLQRELEQEKAELRRSYEQLRSAHERISLMSGVLSEHLTGKLLDGKYLLEQKIDSGGFGVIYQARHVALQRQVAVKILRLLQPDDADRQLERFRREGISACRVLHANAVAVLDSGVAPEGIPYLVMELLKGQTLLARLEQRGGWLPVEECLRIMEPVCEVLVEAHAAGVIHRDIKPDNIFLHTTAEGEVVKVLDFGIAALRSLDDRALTRLTNPELTIGTAQYMAPERLRNEVHDGRSDVYSVSVMLYVMLSGRMPFTTHAENRASTPFAHLYEQPMPLELPEHRQQPRLEALVMAGLVKDPEQRPSIGMFLVQLRAATEK